MSRYKIPFFFNSQKVSIDTGVFFDPDEMPSVTKQEFELEANVNEIARRYGLTGQLPPPVEGFFGDVTNVPLDLMSAHSLAADAARSWADLPTVVKDKFGNPQNFINFIESPDFVASDFSDLFKEPTSDLNSNHGLPPTLPPNVPPVAPIQAPEPPLKE